VGMAIGLAVILGFSFSPVIFHEWGASMLFYICAGMTLAAVIYTLLFLKNNSFHTDFHEDEIHIDKKNLRAIFRNSDHIRLNITGFAVYFSLTSVFFVMPLLIAEQIKIMDMTRIFIPMGIIGTALMFYFARVADKKGTVRVAVSGLGFELVGVLIPLFSQNLYALFISFIVFYSGHCILSPVLPVAVSRFPGRNIKGTAMSVFYSFLFLGSGLGGIISGQILEIGDHRILFGILIILLVTAVISISGFRDYKESG